MAQIVRSPMTIHPLEAQPGFEMLSAWIKSPDLPHILLPGSGCSGSGSVSGAGSAVACPIVYQPAGIGPISWTHCRSGLFFPAPRPAYPRAYGATTGEPRKYNSPDACFQSHSMPVLRDPASCAIRIAPLPATLSTGEIGRKPNSHQLHELAASDVVLIRTFLSRRMRRNQKYTRIYFENNCFHCSHSLSEYRCLRRAKPFEDVFPFLGVCLGCRDKPGRTRPRRETRDKQASLWLRRHRLHPGADGQRQRHPRHKQNKRFCCKI